MKRILKRFKSGNMAAAAAASKASADETFEDVLEVETDAEKEAREAAEKAAREKAEAAAREEAEKLAREEAAKAAKEEELLSAVRDAAKAAPAGSRKPRLMVAGEFSAGKTHLITGLLGEKVLPSNVTATALPPIWLVWGKKAMLAVDVDGKTREIKSLEEVTVEDTHYVVLSHPAPLLKSFDIIDTPGNSDPNIPSECWERMLDYADAVIWCTNATQAWRQSEKSVWNEMPARLLEKATILITHADRITDARSYERVQRRVKREAGKYFDSFLMASLLKEDDLARIRTHLTEVTSEIEACDGAACPITAEFAKANKMTEAEEKAALEAPAPEALKPAAVSPKRVNGSRPAKAAKSDKKSSPKTEDTPSAEVHVFVPPTAEEADRAKGAARSLWEQVSKDLDQSDATAVLACVEQFIDALDERGGALDAVTTSNASEEEDAAAGLIQSSMSRRKP